MSSSRSAPPLSLLPLYVWVLLLGLAAFPTLLHAQPPEHRITSLPGWNGGGGGFDQYAGYIDVGTGRHLHYWFVTSQRSPVDDPVLLWLNGGPGCSSLVGLLTENGPFSPTRDGAALMPNPNSWNKVANVLYVEGPAGVGFSYEDAGMSMYTDNITAADNFQFLVSWFKLFPNFTNNEFYISGESYAGHYIPTLVEVMLSQPNAIPNFKGFTVGNPSTTRDRTNQQASLSLYLQTHGFLALNSTSGRVTTHYDHYDILADDCERADLLEHIRFPNLLIDGLREKETQRRRLSPITTAPVERPCIANDLSAYLNRADVQAAIHAKLVRKKQWHQCDLINYQFGPDSLPLYSKFMNQSSIRIWVFSGDLDTVINFIGTEWWVNGLGRKVIREWSPWRWPDSKGRLGGFHVIYDRITFLTVRGAGHMVAATQPGAALTLITSFLNGSYPPTSTPL
eukprot:NODE_565_length_1535_cov_301.841857_g426_i0.p1 GENE.NODE_565_length_1535_cov_301.841857_g426_i0~~NODE_565_length_1535_cov_301.841857_g426_i0.p1  ORF type:complete len:452 (-),score=81.98 NODE_565_length_1535_cov_301.841857_g426_i0:108-1463(-)